ncbi:MAG: hypothetical protein ACJAZY_000057 [Spirosomataceae bacterium]|jgi:hypothetical protein
MSLKANPNTTALAPAAVKIPAAIAFKSRRSQAQHNRNNDERIFNGFAEEITHQRITGFTFYFSTAKPAYPRSY